ncbi:MAG: transcriptional regulator [Bacteroidetes bacterium]|nr:transcriptional regulator [Bacteroidota bacterium]
MFVFLRTYNSDMDSKAENIEKLTTFAKAMGHPTRMEILAFLLEQNTCYFGDIHEVFPNAKATISQHLKELKSAGLIQGEIEGPKVKYCINKENWELARLLFADFFKSNVKTKCC